MAFNYRPGPTKRDKELSREARRLAKADRLAGRREAKLQFPSRYPNAPEDAAGVGRTLSRGLP
jgi:hypothetical protein